MNKPKARVTILLEYELETVEGMSPEDVLNTDINEMTVSVPDDVKVSIVRKEIL